MLPEKKKKRRKRPADGGSPSSGTEPGSPVSSPGSASAEDPEISGSAAFVLPSPKPRPENASPAKPAAKGERPLVGAKPEKAGRRSTGGQDKTGTFMMYGILTLVVAFAGALVFVALKAPAADLVEL